MSLEWLNPPPALLAQIQTDRWPEVARIWRSAAKLPYLSTGQVVLGLGGLVVVVATLLWWIERRRSRTQRAHPLALFQRLATEMGLGLSDRWLLIRIARQQGLSSPLTLLLSPATLEHHARNYAQARPGASGNQRWARAERVKVKLFGGRANAGGATGSAEVGWSASPGLSPRNPDQSDSGPGELLIADTD